MSTQPVYPHPTTLTDESMRQAAAWLAGHEPVFQTILDRFGLPPFWQRPPGFATLVHVILEQQVSLASAQATLNKLLRIVPNLTPQAFLSLDSQALRTIGFSRQKAGYCRGVAEALLSGALDLEQVSAMSDEEARDTLVRLKGVGIWTADTYLLISLCRPDIFPVQDLGLIVGVRKAWKLAENPARESLLEMAEAWRPYRSAATRLIWHWYLSTIGDKPA